MIKKISLFCILFLIAGCTKQVTKWEVVIHSNKGKLENNRLILQDPDQNVTAFTKGEPHQVKSISLENFIEEWDSLFARSAPNATISLVTSDGMQKNVVVVLKNPKLMDDTLEFSIDPIDSTVQGSFQNPIIYIDNFCLGAPSWLCSD